MVAGCKPYWAVLQKGSLTLYYDASQTEAKDNYYMVKVRDLYRKGKTQLSFENPHDQKTMVYDFDDQELRNDWYYLVASMKEAVKVTHIVGFIHAGSEDKTI